MANFSHLKSMQVTGDRTAKYTIYEISLNDEYPTLIMKPAGEANKPYFNALLKRASKNRRQLAAGAINPGMVAENRQQDRELFPETVIVGWENVTDADGAVVPFSKDECKEFIANLPDYVFDGVVNYARDMANFSDLPDAEGSAKN